MRYLRLISGTLVTISVLGVVTIAVASSEPGQAETSASRAEGPAKQVQPEAEAGVRRGEPGACTALGKAGMVVHIDPKTGRRTARPAAEQSAATAAALKAMANRSSAGLVEELVPAGGVKVNLRGRFRTPSMARVGNDGKVVVGHFPCPPEVQPVNETPSTDIDREE